MGTDVFYERGTPVALGDPLRVYDYRALPHPKADPSIPRRACLPRSGPISPEARLSSLCRAVTGESGRLQGYLAHMKSPTPLGPS